MNRLPIFNYAVRNTSGTSLEIFIDGEIVDAGTQQFIQDWFGDDTTVSFKSFRDQVNAAVKGGATIINGTINSPGGMVTEAMAIHDFLTNLQDKGVTVNMTGTGIVASAATYILMASRSATMTSNSWLMIHNVSGFAWGDVEQVESQARTLRQFNDRVRDFYANCTGQPKKNIEDMMSAETWMTADQAKENGFIKNVSAEVAATNSIKPEQWLFRNTAVLNAYNSSIKNSFEMDFSKITEAINSGFNNLIAKLGISNEKEGASDALNEFSTGITNALKETVPDAERIQKMVDDAVSNSMSKAFETLPENITTAITDAVKNAASAEDLNKLSNELEETKKAIANRTAGAGKPAANNSEPSIADHPGITWGEDE
jgi:ATP-dependent protease ClpP protease subunit